MAQALSKPLTKHGEAWLTHVRQWQAARTTQIQYCKDQGLSVRAFRWWRRRLERRGQIQPTERRNAAPAPAVRFTEIPMPMPPEVAAGYAYEIALPNHVQLRLRKHFEPEAVSTLLALLGQAC